VVGAREELAPLTFFQGDKAKVKFATPYPDMATEQIFKSSNSV